MPKHRQTDEHIDRRTDEKTNRWFAGKDLDSSSLGLSQIQDYYTLLKKMEIKERGEIGGERGENGGKRGKNVGERG